MAGTDAEPRDAAWNRVSEQFATLGENLRRRFESDDPPAAEEDGVRESLQDAIRTLGDAAERLATTVGSVIRDPEVQTEAKQAASSLVDALGMTFSQVGGEIRRRVDRSDAGGTDDAWDEPAPTVEVVERLGTPTSPTTPPTDPDGPPATG